MRSSIAARLAREIGGFLCTRPAKVSWPGGAVSFTFDDFPRSAWLNGGAILERHGLRGTYYAALNLAGTENHLGPMFTIDDLREVHARGHEIACHTFNHRDCRRAPASEILAEIDENAAALSRLLDGATMSNFAYPYGAVSLAAKHALSRRFASCRSTGQGINQGTVDLADLLGIHIYAGVFDRARLCQLIDDSRAQGGWIVFYTHDVSDTPSAFGCTPEQLEWVVAYAAQNATVLPVDDMLRSLGLPGEKRANKPQADKQAA
ncbi:MAG TPA: polysaccharide deacetylase family protein [Stellaceae bacterium]|nr:polysaccharide deacetylase family protein [Stellaceae bacterium]